MIRQLAVFALAAAALSAAVIALEPSSGTVAAGQNFTLNVGVDNVTDLYAFQFDVGFNPALLAAVSVTEGPLFSSGVSFMPGFIDNTAGTITLVADALAGPGPGVNGPGTLATIQFSALAPGTGTVSLANATLLDSALNEIAVTSADSRIIIEPSSVPEPTSMVLLGSGAAVGLLIIRRRRV